METFIITFPGVIALLFGLLMSILGSVISILLWTLSNSIIGLKLAVNNLDLNRQSLDSRVTTIEAGCAIRHGQHHEGRREGD